MPEHPPERIMPTHVYSIESDQPLRAAVTLMREKNISCLPVLRGGVAVGILTERDLVRIVLNTGLDLEGYLVRDVMSSRVVVASEHDDLYEIYSRMCGNRIRHLVLTDDREAVAGVKTFTDLMSGLGREYLAEIKTVGDVMTRDAVTASREDTVRSVLNLMLEHGISCVPVVEHGRAVGILTERDLSRLTTSDASALLSPVSDVMSKPVHAVSGEMYAFEAVAAMNDFGVRHLVVNDADGLLIGLITQSDMVATLIKRHANLEFMVRKRTRQLTRKSEELEFSNQQLRHLDEIKSAFLSSVSHELRTPLTSLLGFAKITGKTFSRHFGPLVQEDDKLRAQAAKILGNLDILVHEGERMARLINDFLDLTKIEAGRVDWQDKLVHVADFVFHAGHSLQGQFEAKENLELRILVEDDLPMVFVDVDRMLQVMINLLSNAAKFTDRGRVTVEALNVDNQFVEIRVADTGMGIPESELSKVFDKFHQMEQRGQGQEVKGTGLGLAICKEIVEHYRGRIWVESEVGRGSCFKFRLPAAGPKSRERFPEPIVQASPVTTAQEAPLVMAVDDSPAIREYLDQLFVDEGFRVVTVPDGVTALRVAEEVLPQCIIMDLMMPGMDGGEVIRRLRENPVTKDIPVVILSAYPHRRSSGEDAALAKPVDESMLVQTVRGLIRGGRIKGRKCILVPNAKPEGNMLMIAAGKLRYVRPEELADRFSDKFAGTVYLPGRGAQPPEVIGAISRINDVLIMILPEEQEADALGSSVGGHGQRGE
ncbi:hybrid sensor histidine kinase/response regulator [Desulfonatronum lacustre]|uniref:hybrid sensor histidine kinase/response regulator n=1 Tax=Desulfonatronum lacustre TaxID=66849 RepID=UPI000A040C82|nr:CBS domain-containing protein [Desulfonatronum lacustre]